MADTAIPSGSDRLIGEAECRHRSGLSRTERWRREQLGTFPKRLKLGPRVNAWLESEIEAWIAQQVARRDSGAKAA